MTGKTIGDFEDLVTGFAFCEAPRMAPDGSVWFSDLLGGTVHRRDPDGCVQTMLAGRAWVGGLVHDVSGAVLCAGRGGIVALDPASGATRVVLDAIDGAPIIAVNDIEGDGHGGLYGGTIDFVAIMERGAPPAPGVFFHMDAAGAVTVLRRGVHASNGIALSADGRWLYHSETGRGIWRYRLAAGRPEAPELFIALDDSDGIVADQAGGLWVACWQSGTLRHFAASGAMTQALSARAPHIVSVAFAHDDPHVLLVTTGGNADVAGAGGLMRLRVDVPGVREHSTRLASLAANG